MSRSQGRGLARPLDRRGSAVALALVLLFSALAAGVSVAPAAGPMGATLAGVSPSLAALPAPAAPPPVVGFASGGAPVSGPGLFYQTSSLPSPALANETCANGNCYNVSNDVSVNATRGGLLVAAYTSLTNQSPCAALRPFSVSNIAFVTSRNNGTSWSGAKYLGNPDCSGAAAGYPDAWQPAITSLANGTLVLSYVEYNLTAGTLPPLASYSWPPTQSRLVLTESYDNGSTWTNPAVLNLSNPPGAPPGIQFTPALPSITAFGDTIYLTWMSLTQENGVGAIALLVSSNGGTTWSPTVPVSLPGSFYSMDPQVAVDAKGHIYIAYTSDVTDASFFCGSEGCLGFGYGTWQGDVLVASSATNGTYFNYTTVATGIPLGSNQWNPYWNPTTPSPFETPAPQLAVGGNATSPILYLAFTGGVMTNGSSYCPALPTGCLVNDLFFYTSTDGGVSWTSGNIGTTVLNPATIDPTGTNASANDSVTSVALAAYNGSVYLEAGLYNGTLCFGSSGCGAMTEVVFSTANNGTTFTTPAVAAAAYSPEPFSWSGEYSAAIVVGGVPQFYWSSNGCPSYASSGVCTPYPYSGLPVSVVEETTAATGPGVTLSFVASGIPANQPWTVSVLGNVRAGLGNQTLSVSGVPVGPSISWMTPSLAAPGYEYRVSGMSAVPPVSLTANLTVTIDYATFVAVSINLLVPNINGGSCGGPFAYYVAYCPPTFYPTCLDTAYTSNTWGCYSSYYNPIPPSGSFWVKYGTHFSYQLTSIPSAPCPTYYCYAAVYNLSFAGWSGSGPGSVSTSSPDINFTALGPIAEQATFFVNEICGYEIFAGFVYTVYCAFLTSTLTVQETGLPSGTPWGVTLSGAAGAGTQETTAGSTIVNSAALAGLGEVTPWNVPSATPGMVWVGTISSGDAVVLPDSTPVTVQYTLEAEPSVRVLLSVRTEGLAPGLPGNVTLTNLATGAAINVIGTAPGTNLSIPAGTYSVTVPTVSTTSGTDYLSAEVYSTLALENLSNQSGRAPFDIVLDGAATLTLAYAPEYWVTIAAGLGGTVAPASEFVLRGGSVRITASADPGYSFVEWSGSGPGSIGGSAASSPVIVVQPSGPVSELATFEPTPAPVYSVAVSATGIPQGQAFSLELGATSYSGAGSFVITGLAAGTYAVAVPDVTGAGAAISRYVESGLSASNGLSGSSLALTQNDTLSVAFTAQYLVDISVLGQGSVSIAAGSYWMTASSTLRIAATPASGQVFAEWWADNDSAGSHGVSNSTSLALPLLGSVDLVAQFAPAPIASVTTFSLTVNETGLPAGTAWQFVLTPGTGVGGTGANLTATGLRGSYSLALPSVYTSSGVRYVGTLVGSANLSLTSDLTLAATFAEQYLVTTAVANSTAPGAIVEWVGAGSSIDLSAPASPVAGWIFLGWSGVGPGSYSGPNASEVLTPIGPVTETANFGPAPTVAGTAAIPDTALVAIGLVAAIMLVVGAFEGVVMGRRRRRPPSRPSEASSTPAVLAAPAPPPGPAAQPPSAEWQESPGSSPAWRESEP